VVGFVVCSCSDCFVCVFGFEGLDDMFTTALLEFLFVHVLSEAATST
jgi:hypothetical protein